VTPRLFIDVTRTHSSPYHSGIQKVVRGLYRALKEMDACRYDVVPVILTPRGAVAADDLPVHPFELDEGNGADGETPANVIRLAPSRIDRLRSTLMMRSETSLAAASALAVLRVAARAVRMPGRVRGHFVKPPVVDFRKGDILLMPDTAWQSDPWPTIAQVRTAQGKVAAIWYDLIPLSHPDHFHPELPGPFRGYFERMLGEADLMIAISAAVEREIGEWAARLGHVAPALAHAWPGVRLAAVVPRRDRVDAILRKPTVLIVATLEPRKGHDLLIDACERLWAAGRDFNLLIAGRFGWRVDSLYNRIRNHGELDERLHHFDDLSDGEIVDLYRHCAVLALPSLAEGFGLPIVEAELAGCPSVVSDLPVFREIASPATHVFAPRTAAALEPFIAAGRPPATASRNAGEAGFARYAADVVRQLDALDDTANLRREAAR
jgi:glycosyltransferase involved in cell wall biosynthesis